MSQSPKIKHPTGSRKSAGGSQADAAARSICSFWLGSRCFGLDVDLVGEVVTATGVAPVPMTPHCVRGLFNLRGMPVALVDLAEVLEFAHQGRKDASEPTALVLRTEGVVVGVVIDKMDAVIPGGRGAFTAADHATEHAAVQGFLELTDDRRRVVTLLDPLVLMERLDRLRPDHKGTN
jgi:purine-binding chemotaxis protein CheW